jgi:hypothetical protein
MFLCLTKPQPIYPLLYEGNLGCFWVLCYRQQLCEEHCGTFSLCSSLLTFLTWLLGVGGILGCRNITGGVVRFLSNMKNQFTITPPICDHQHRSTGSPTLDIGSRLNICQCVIERQLLAGLFSCVQGNGFELRASRQHSRLSKH